MVGKISISLIVGAIVSGVVWGVLYQETHNQYTELNSYLDRLAGNYDSLRNQKSLQDNAAVYALLGGIVAGGILLAILSSGSSPSPVASAETVTNTSAEKKCPYCAEIIKRYAKICRYCGREILNTPAPVTKAKTTKETKYLEKSSDIISESTETSPNAKSSSGETTPTQVILWGMTRVQWMVVSALAIGIVILFCLIALFVLQTIQPNLLSRSATLPAVMNPLAIPQPPPTLGATSISSCGNYRIVQEIGLVPFRSPNVTRVTVLDERSQQIKTFETNQSDETLIFTLDCSDLIGNGVSQLIVKTRTQGNDCCSIYDILSMTEGLPSLLHWDASTGGISRYTLLKGKPPYEIVGYDDRIALDRIALEASLPFAYFPLLPIVFTLQNDKYVPATVEYPEILRDDPHDGVSAIGTM